MIYIVGANGHPYLKVGYTRNLKRRIAALQTGSPYALVVRATLPGDQAVEAAMHRMLTDKRVSGEWFDASVKDCALAWAEASGDEDAFVPRLDGNLLDWFAQLAIRRRVVPLEDAIRLAQEQGSDCSLGQLRELFLTCMRLYGFEPVGHGNGLLVDATGWGSNES